MNGGRSETETCFLLFSSPTPLPQKEKKKENYLCSTWFELKVNPILPALQQIFLKLAFLRCDIIIKVDYRCPKESDFSSYQRQSLKGSYAPDLSSCKKSPSTHSTASSQIHYLELREHRCDQFTREKGNMSMVNVLLTDIGKKHEQSFSPEYLYINSHWRMQEAHHLHTPLTRYTQLHPYTQNFPISSVHLAKNATSPYLQDTAKNSIKLSKS